jgi:hypothetical protein
MRPGVYVCHLGRSGVGGCVERGGGLVPWYVRPGPVPIRLSDGPVDPRRARLILLDLVRQAQAIEDKRLPIAGWKHRRRDLGEADQVARILEAT